ncbi:Ulp1 protease family, C-terminal catalytic domain containing protein [Parasponia andersonii]|uniref:Ulp1 protease family, C-terminal catalytic domain containing protein n=1 Tax=Parasponia andersonii TaxID=3476 RepID=A0A2P5DPG4_PARAD|nr:Ulp1 protease family, C-terminal catalytic domain containing protein [Parasponia andersonii]
MMHQRENYLQKMKKNKNAKEAKYTVYGFSIALHYCAYEAIPKLTGAFSENLGIKFPRILSWTSNKIPLMMDCIDVFKIKKHIDAAFRLIREYLWLFPKTYKKKVALVDTVYIACMNGRWDAFRRTSNKAKFLWDDQLTDNAKRYADHFQRGWVEIDEVYYPLNIGSNHWVLVQIDLPAHMLTVYDSDQALYDDARVEQAMRPMMKMLLYFLLNVEEVTDRADLDLTTTTKPRDFNIRKLPPNVVHKQRRADIPLSNVVDDVMQHSRQKLCVDLFYQNIEP